MRAYKYYSKVTENGMIQIPMVPALLGKDVEIIIIPKEKSKKSKISAIEFVNKWAGFLKNKDTDASKYEYLSEKYK